MLSTAAVTGTLTVNLYHSLDKLSRWQSDDIYAPAIDMMPGHIVFNLCIRAYVIPYAVTYVILLDSD